MTAVAVRAATVHKEETARSRPVGGRRVRRRSRARARSVFNLAVSLLALVFVFGYVSVYAHLTTTANNRSALDAMCRQERIKNERLKIEFIRRSSPHNVMAAAQTTGMVYATDYDYLSETQTVASARR